MNNWITSIVGLSILSIIIEIIMPEGNLNKYIKRVFGIILLIAIVTPICEYLGGDISLDSIIYTANYQTDSNYLENIDKDIENQCVAMCSNLLEAEDISCDISIDVDDLKIKKVDIKIKNEVMEQDDVNIDIRTKILNIVTKVCNCDKDKVVIYEID